MRILFVYILLFIYEYDIKIKQVPLSFPKIIVLLLLIYGINNIKYFWKFLRNRNVFLILILYIYLIIYSLILPIILKTYDLILFKTFLISFIEVFVGSFFIVTFINKTVDLDYYEIISNLSFAQAIIIIVFYLFPTLRNYIYDNYLVYNFNVFFNLHNKYFNRGVGLIGFGALFSIVQFIGAYTSLLKIEKFKNRIFLIVQVISVILMARTGLINFILAIILIFIFGCFNKKFRVIFKMFLILFFKAFLLLISIYIIFFKENNKVNRLINHSFELFINLFKNHSFRTESTDDLLTNMLFLPKEIPTYLFGDGRIVDPILGNYMGTDSGYLQILFFGGLLFLILYYFFNFFIIKTVYNYSNNEQEKLWILILGIILFVCEIKGSFLKSFVLSKLLFIMFWIQILKNKRETEECE